MAERYNINTANARIRVYGKRTRSSSANVPFASLYNTCILFLISALDRDANARVRVCVCVRTYTLTVLTDVRLSDSPNPPDCIPVGSPMCFPLGRAVRIARVLADDKFLPGPPLFATKQTGADITRAFYARLSFGFTDGELRNY